MAENISLDKMKQSTFDKAVKNIKRIIKENKSTPVDSRVISTPVKSSVIVKKDVLGKKKTDVLEKKKAIDLKEKTIQKEDFKDRGVVYLRHIPHGFYEEQMEEYFSQFGKVTRVNLVRSKKTGKPRGFAFVEFLYPEVAQIAAETMNNYLMFNRLVKAEYIPGEKVEGRTFKTCNIRSDNCYKTKAQWKYVNKKNKKKFTDAEVTKMARHQIKNLGKLGIELKKRGIHFNCQVTDMKNNKISSVPVLELDESDGEIEYKVHPNVVVLKREKNIKAEPESSKNEQNSSLSSLENIEAQPDSPKNEQNRKRTLSSDSNSTSKFQKKHKSQMEDNPASTEDKSPKDNDSKTSSGSKQKSRRNGEKPSLMTTLSVKKLKTPGKNMKVKKTILLPKSTSKKKFASAIPRLVKKTTVQK